MSDDLENRHCVVTGGTGALGRAVIAELLEQGARVHVPCIEATVPDGLAGAGSDRVDAVASVDLTSEEGAARYFGSLPPLWASVHCAGGFGMGAVTETSLADFRHMWEMNVVACFLSCREAVRSMRKGGKGGRIVNVAARPALEPAGGMVAYTTAKAAVASMTECLARELAGDGILVNAIVPAMIDTPVNREAMPDADHDTWPKPAEIAQVIAFAISPANALTSGALLPVYGRLL